MNAQFAQCTTFNNIICNFINAIPCHCKFWIHFIQCKWQQQNNQSSLVYDRYVLYNIWASNKNDFIDSHMAIGKIWLTIHFSRFIIRTSKIVLLPNPMWSNSIRTHNTFRNRLAHKTYLLAINRKFSSVNVFVTVSTYRPMYISLSSSLSLIIIIY